MQRWQAAVGQMRAANGLGTFAGCWEMTAPFVLGYDTLPIPTINALIAGAIVALVSIHLLGTDHLSRMFWVVPVVGVWLIISPVILHYSGLPRTNDVTVGIVVAILGTWSAITAVTASG
jgi:hypothetical protein